MGTLIGPRFSCAQATVAYESTLPPGPARRLRSPGTVKFVRVGEPRL